MQDQKPLVADRRALSQAGLAALAFAVTIATVAGAGLLLMQAGNNLQESGPVVSVDAKPVDANNGDCCQRVRLVHESGDSVNLTRLELVVRLPEHDKQARLRDLPTRILDQGDYTGHHIFTLGDTGIGGVADADVDTDGEYDAGEVIEFRIAHQRVDLRPGDHVEVSFRHGEADTEIRRVNTTVVSS